jgi:hypothetical protein
MWTNKKRNANLTLLRLIHRFNDSASKHKVTDFDYFQFLSGVGGST